jgi:cytidyltransferase-like protein
MRHCIYPGTFDPITCGHLDVLSRAARLFDKVTVAVADNPAKAPLFTAEERKAMILPNVGKAPNVTVTTFERSAGRLCGRAEGRRHHPRAARPLRLRVRVQHGAHEPAPPADDRDDLRDAERAVQLHELVPGEAGGALRRRGGALRAANVAEALKAFSG